jgi:hypothetical protein
LGTWLRALEQGSLHHDTTPCLECEDERISRMVHLALPYMGRTDKGCNDFLALTTMQTISVHNLYFRGCHRRLQTARIAIINMSMIYPLPLLYMHNPS